MRVPPERWAELEPHFDRALDIEADEREKYLEELAAEDPSLAEDLRHLLAAESSLDDLRRHSPDVISAVGGEQQPIVDPTGRHIGPYRVISTLGTGGMSVVYLAERTDGKFDQQVAVKVMRWNAAKDALPRFEREQQTLARLDHPAMTRIYDAGVTDDGLPYYVMEPIDGVAITEYCREQGHTVRERVRLMISVCVGVHSAHQSLIVHRDLKPDNVMVTRDGHVKILDFGIAKWIEEDAQSQATLMTRHGEGLLTPQYASPEQFLGRPVTTASDVYSLGLLLYEMLAGTPPYDLSRKNPTEQQRLVCETQPARPSEQAADPQIGREVRGDLETIVLTALAKGPERRYSSASAMATDLRHYLDGLPIEAAPDSMAYRMGKFVQRNRVGVAVAALAAVTLVAGIVSTTWQARTAARERDRARIEAARAQEVVDFLIGSLEQANPYSDRAGEEVTVREMLENSVDRVENELIDQPEVQTLLYTTMAQVYGHLGQSARGVELADKAISLADSLYGAQSLESATARYHKARSIGHTDATAAGRSYREAMDALRQHEDTDSRIMLANVLEDYGMSLLRRGAGDSALALEREALSIREAVYDTLHADLARSHHHLAGTLSSLKDPAAGAHFAAAAFLWKATLGEHHPNYGATLNDWAVWHQTSGRPDSAEVYYLMAIEVDRKTLGPRSSSLATRLNNLASLSIAQGRFAFAEEMLEESIDILGAVENSGLSLAAAHTNMGHAAFFQQNYEAAETEYQEGRRLFVSQFGENHPYPAVSDSYLGRLYWKSRRTAEAVFRLQRAQDAFEPLQPSLADRLTAVETWYGCLLNEQGSDRGAVLLRAAVARAREHLPEGSVERAEAETALGIYLIDKGSRDEGLPYLEAGYEGLSAACGENHPLRLWVEAALERAKG
jgi:tetratricopeptide (TPR) repeat protein